MGLTIPLSQSKLAQLQGNKTRIRGTRLPWQLACIFSSSFCKIFKFLCCQLSPHSSCLVHNIHVNFLYRNNRRCKRPSRLFQHFLETRKQEVESLQGEVSTGSQVTCSEDLLEVRSRNKPSFSINLCYFFLN